MIRSTAFALLLLTTATPGQAQGLANEADLNAGLEVIRAGDLIRKRCDSIDARMVRAIAYVRQLRGLARDRGYSRDEIERYIDDDAAKARVESRVQQYLASRGLGAGAPEDYCRVGQAEIAAGTPIGRLLSAD